MFLLKLGHSFQGHEIMCAKEPILKGASPLYENETSSDILVKLISILFFFLSAALKQKIIVFRSN